MNKDVVGINYELSRIRNNASACISHVNIIGINVVVELYFQHESYFHILDIIFYKIDEDRSKLLEISAKNFAIRFGNVSLIVLEDNKYRFNLEFNELGIEIYAASFDYNLQSSKIVNT